MQHHASRWTSAQACPLHHRYNFLVSSVAQRRLPVDLDDCPAHLNPKRFRVAALADLHGCQWNGRAKVHAHWWLP